MKDKLGTAEAYNHYSVGWAWAMCAPYQWTKQVASHWGGTRNGTIVHWPAGHHQPGRDPLAVHPRHRRRADRARGGGPAGADVRQRRAAGADRGHEHALQLRRRPTPRSATTCSTSRWPATAASTSRAGARSRGTAPRGCPTEVLPALDDDVWELYDGTSDWTQAHDLAAELPGQARGLQRLWLIEAVKYNVLPIDDRRFERLNADHRRSAAAHQRQPAGAVPGHEAAHREQRHRRQEPLVHASRRRSTTPASRADQRRASSPRVAASAAGRSTSRTGRATFVYNLLGMQEFVTDGDRAGSRRQPPGARRVRLRRRRPRQGR